MKNNNNIKQLLYKFVRNQCSEEEVAQVVAYFREHKNTSDFPTVEEVLQLLDHRAKMSNEASERVYQKILKKRKTTSSPFKRVYKYAVAACIAGLLLVGYLNRDTLFSAQSPSSGFYQNDFITLQLGNGETKIINLTDSTLLTNKSGDVIGKQEGKQLAYSDTKNTMQYNTIKVPYGKTFQLRLADGTQVFLNAGTSLKYPVSFSNRKERKVYLTGEAFFKVIKDTKHPFIIHTNGVNIKDFGTEFNVSAYPEDTQTEVVLVEGSVGMYTGKKARTADITFLVPGEKGSYDRLDKTITKKTVDVTRYTAWMNGDLIFRNEPFKNMLRKMERHFDITIINRDTALAKVSFYANFGREPYLKIFKHLKTIYNINYNIEGKQITILGKKP